MTKRTDGFHLLADELNPSIVKRIFDWREDPELGRLVTKLLSHTSRKAFLDSFAEAMVALHLVESGCSLKFEVPTPQGKRCDFEVNKGSEQFFLHIKRVDSDLPRIDPALMRTMTRKLRVLEDIHRPFIVQARWNYRLTKAQMNVFIDQAGTFIQQARVGEEMIARDDEGLQLGGLRVVAPWDGDHVNVMIGLRNSFVDLSPRFRKLLEKAHQQFMPKAVNVILIGSDHSADAIDFEAALLGSHIERWDAFPQRGKRLAHGRADDGFWTGVRVPESAFASWFHFTPDRKQIISRLWVREPSPSPVHNLLNQLFSTEND